MTTFTPYPAKVTKGYREALMALYPALQAHQRSFCYRRLLEYILFSSHREEDTGRLVMPRYIVRALAGDDAGPEDEFAAIKVMESFSADVFALDIGTYVIGEKARTISSELPEALLELGGSDDLTMDAGELVWFVSGLPVSPSSRRKSAARYKENITLLAEGVPEEHPAAQLLDYLNTQPATTLTKIVRRNWPALTQMWHAMPQETEQEDVKKRSVGYCLRVLDDYTRNVYKPSQKTVRIHTLGTTIHSLPRKMRKMALAGAIEMDIRSSQLAIVSTLWGLEKLTAFLAGGNSIWPELLGYLKLPNEAKDTLKTTLYAATFGMGRTKLKELVADGLGHELAHKFMKHPLIQELLQGRSRRMKSIKEAGGITDAFGRWVGLDHDHAQHALMAVEAQSWELRLMLPIFDVVKELHDVAILSWLHDGVVLWRSDQREDRIASLKVSTKTAFDSHAILLGFPTELEQVVL